MQRKSQFVIVHVFIISENVSDSLNLDSSRKGEINDENDCSLTPKTISCTCRIFNKDYAKGVIVRESNEKVTSSDNDDGSNDGEIMSTVSPADNTIAYDVILHCVLQNPFHNNANDLVLWNCYRLHKRQGF